MESKNIKIQATNKPQGSKWKEKAEWIVKNKHWIKEAAIISVRIQEALKDEKITQKALAERLSVAPQWINRVIKGKENLTLSSIKKIESALNIRLIHIADGKRNNVTEVTLRKKNNTTIKTKIRDYSYKNSKKICFDDQIEQIPTESIIIDIYKRA